MTLSQLAATDRCFLWS